MTEKLYKDVFGAFLFRRIMWPYSAALNKEKKITGSTRPPPKKRI